MTWRRSICRCPALHPSLVTQCHCFSRPFAGHNALLSVMWLRSTLQEKLAPLSREQLEELVVGLVARDEGLGNTVLRLAKKQVWTSFLTHVLLDMLRAT